MRLLALITLAMAFSSCNSSTKCSHQTREDSIYLSMHETFVGKPDTAIIKPLVKRLLAKYGSELFDDDPAMLGQMTTEFRKMSVVGVTEMDILKHIYQHGDRCEPLDKNIVMSYMRLEKRK